MRKLSLALFVLSILVAGARLFTGVIYLSDEPTAVLVLKQHPAMWMERPAVQDRPLSEQIVLDSEEPNLAYGRLYLSLVQMAPMLVAILVGAGIVLLTVSGRREARSPRSGAASRSAVEHPRGKRR